MSAILEDSKLENDHAEQEAEGDEKDEEQEQDEDEEAGRGVKSGGREGDISNITQPRLTEDGKHLLHSGFSFWYIKRKLSTNESYDQNIKKLATFFTVEDFWHYYSHIVRPNELASVDYHCFREGITPLWEDEANKDGGKWVIRLKKGMASRCWEDALLAVIGDAFRVGDHICGVVISTKGSEDTLSFWNKRANLPQLNLSIRDVIRNVLSIESEVALEYRPHSTLMMHHHKHDPSMPPPHSHSHGHNQGHGHGHGHAAYQSKHKHHPGSRKAPASQGEDEERKPTGGGGGGAVDEEGFEQPKQRKQRTRRPVYAAHDSA